MPPKPLATKLMKGLLAVELLGLLGAYILFHRLDLSQDFRSSMNRKFPSILEVYYQSNEFAGVYGIREKDQEAWANQH